MAALSNREFTCYLLSEVGSKPGQYRYISVDPAWNVRPVLPRRFFRHVKLDELTGCCNWTGSTCTNLLYKQHSYGQIKVWHQPTQTGLVIMAHRFAYLITQGPIPEGWDVDHLCHNKLCVNPSHLEAVPHSENMRRMHDRFALIGAPWYLAKRKIASGISRIYSKFQFQYTSGLAAGPIQKILLFLLVFMGPFASFPAKRLPQVQAVCDYLVWARDSESDVWLRDDYQIALLTCLHAADGSTSPAVQATRDYLGLDPAEVWPAILARRIAKGYPLETIPTSLPPKKSVESVREVIPEKKEA